jgi:N6-L-threonylcarbamoyladenine synthase/protein kinase Bud32
MPFFGPVLGIEGTAWNLSAAVFDETLISLSSDPYTPAQGGIHPREAAQHHASAMKRVVSEAMPDPGKIRGIAFSRGPGLGPCLRTVATAARSLSLSLGIPLIGVNHCIAHVEIGRYATGCEDPIVLYVSGANTQVLGYLDSRYRIFGETLDIGLGNALDKFARSRGLMHPGGPAIEQLAQSGRYIELPYTVKGMDLAFSGLVSAAKESNAPIEDICHSFQETAFAMCVEVTERALAQTGKEEVLLVGGVGANRRLQDMLDRMCRDRGASFFVPEPRFLGDNGAMIAYTGKIMLESGEFLPVEESFVNPSFRADQVPVSWRKESSAGGIIRSPLDMLTVAKGAEAVVSLSKDTAVKRRVGKSYRNAHLDRKLIAERTRAEARIIAMARRSGVSTPVMRDITPDTIVMERVRGDMLRDALTCQNLEEVGTVIGLLHQAGIVHGDLTTSNIIIRDGRCVLIDFGLSQISSEIETRGVDIHVLFQTLQSTTPEAAALKSAFANGFCRCFPEGEEILVREQEIEQRGRYL